jgi:hypothetical protein
MDVNGIGLFFLAALFKLCFPFILLVLNTSGLVIFGYYAYRFSRLSNWLLMLFLVISSFYMFLHVVRPIPFCLSLLWAALIQDPTVFRWLVLTALSILYPILFHTVADSMLPDCLEIIMFIAWPMSVVLSQLLVATPDHRGGMPRGTPLGKFLGRTANLALSLAW